MADLATLQTWLTEAESARHKLRTGVQEVDVGIDTARVKYTPATASELDAYIVDLKAQIAALELAHPAERRRGLTVDLPGR